MWRRRQLRHVSALLYRALSEHRGFWRWVVLQPPAGPLRAEPSEQARIFFAPELQGFCSTSVHTVVNKLRLSNSDSVFEKQVRNAAAQSQLETRANHVRLHASGRTAMYCYCCCARSLRLEAQTTISTRIFNILDMPAGVVTVTSVQETEAVLGGIFFGVSESYYWRSAEF